MNQVLCALKIGVFLLFVMDSGAQISDSTYTSLNKRQKFHFLTPAALITTGALLSSSTIERDIQNEVRDIVGPDFNTSIDDYTRYVPIGILLGADLAGIPARNHWFDQGKNLAMAIIITDFITFRLKFAIDKERPSGSDELQSMPSAHTSAAFAHASVLFHEFKDTNAWIAYSGYAFATATGLLRVANDKHWTSDVLVGAGIAVLVTEVIYYFDPIIRWNPFKNKNKGQAMVLPSLSNQSYGAQFVLSF